jgi:hypothetical protein
MRRSTGEAKCFAGGEKGFTAAEISVNDEEIGSVAGQIFSSGGQKIIDVGREIIAAPLWKTAEAMPVGRFPSLHLERRS